MNGFCHLRILFGDRAEALDERTSLCMLARAVEFLQFTHHCVDLIGIRGRAMAFTRGGLRSRALRQCGHWQQQHSDG